MDAVGKVTSVTSAKRIVEAHVAGLRARRNRDLLSEKFLLHIDGSGDFQYADIFQGAKVEIPEFVTAYRKSENILRPIVDNAVAHHTTIPLRYFADSSPDRRARNTAMIDTIWANFLSETQDLQGLATEAMYLAMPAGFCPLHAYWRDDFDDGHETVYIGEDGQPIRARSGMIDCFVGNPFDTVFDRTSRRSSIYWTSYARLLPADLVRAKFDHVQGVRGLQGSTRIPSAALFQRIARDWQSTGLGVHGSPVIDVRRGYAEGADEMMTVLCREELPGIDVNFPDGKLQILLVPDVVDFRRGETRADRALLVHEGPLPGRVSSSTNLYSHHRGDDVHGKPWVEDLDPLQIDLNIAISKRWEHITKMAEAPIIGPGGAISEDMLDIGGYNYVEMEPSLSPWRPRVMEWPISVLEGYTKEADEKRKAMYTIGGYQAASRGESPGSRTPFRSIVALQQADSSIHGPVNIRFRRSMCDFMQRCWRQMKQYADIPWLIDIAGDEYAYLVEPYIGKRDLSGRPPKYKLVNGFGASPELRTQEILELMAVKGADGQALLSTEEAKRQFPDQSLFDSQGDPNAVRKRRARTVATAIYNLAQQAREQSGIQSDEPSDPQVQQAGRWVFGQIETKYPRLRDDDLVAHLATLTELTQDETADPIARLAAQARQDLYYQWQAQMATMGGNNGGGQHTNQPLAAKPSPRTNHVDQIAVARNRQQNPTQSLQAPEGEPPRPAAPAPGAELTPPVAASR